MLQALILVGLIVPPITAMLLQRTRLWWIPGVALLIAGIIPFTQFDTASHDEAGVMAGLGNFILLVLGLGLFAYGAILLGIASWRRRQLQPRKPPAPAPLPVATVVAVSKD